MPQLYCLKTFSKTFIYSLCLCTNYITLKTSHNLTHLGPYLFVWVTQTINTPVLIDKPDKTHK